MDQHTMLLRAPSPITPGEEVIYWNLQWDLPLRELLCTPRWRRTTHCPLGSHCPTASWTCWHAICLTWNMHHWQQGPNRNSGLAYPTLSPSSHFWQCCLPLPTCMVCTTWSSSESCQHPSPQGQVGTFCFPLVQSFSHFLCLFHSPGGYYNTRGSPD